MQALFNFGSVEVIRQLLETNNKPIKVTVWAFQCDFDEVPGTV
jgi:hypothetical protein